MVAFADGRETAGQLMSRIGRFKNTLYCSFCGKSQHEVAELISGAQAYICDECVAHAAEIIAERKNKQAPEASHG